MPIELKFFQKILYIYIRFIEVISVPRITTGPEKNYHPITPHMPTIGVHVIFRVKRIFFQNPLLM